MHHHKVLKGIAKREKSSTGWFYGFLYMCQILLSNSNKLEI
ncbi:MAG: transposase [Chlamydia sp.]